MTNKTTRKVSKKVQNLEISALNWIELIKSDLNRGWYDEALIFTENLKNIILELEKEWRKI